ncbi:fumarylacetoacetate hydrolase family protein [Paenarthrobacter sp. YAF11_1]|uniref:fumarylacetoacetate hydrolase family protein n=1 Tax=Paenarthrobacter sp. YAF11_1 TaxID=3233074 RepID=UPI003F946C2A
MNGWSLTTCRIGSAPQDTEQAAIRRSDGSLVVPEVLKNYRGLAAALDDWDRVEPALRNIDVDALEPVEAQEVLSIRYPRKLLCVGANYRDHVAEMGVTDIPDGVRPYFFTVPPTTTMIGNGESIVVGDDPSLLVDWEAELAIVIGRGGRNIPASEALDHVAGYACFNDITARGLLRRDVAVAPPFSFDWFGSKGLDTFCPMGAVTPAWQIVDPEDLEIRCSVNGELKQHGTTRNLIAGVSELIAAASRSCTLEPGDVIATGTPAGVGHSRGWHLNDGDTVHVEITGLASLTNAVRARVGDPVLAPR